MTDVDTKADSARPRDFLREIIDAHQQSGTYGGRVVTRFPPEPNGYLHIGHAKSICLNFGLAKEFAGKCHLRMDDTNPTTEDPEYVESIQGDVRWLGFDWGKNFFHASDYFERLYQYAEQLVSEGKAYVCPLDETSMREWRGTITEPGRPSPGRDNTPEQNLDLLRRMRAGEFADGKYTLRARIDMSAANMKLRDPPLYRIRRAEHYRTGNAWCIYPLYDYAHCLSDSMEGITHSVCTLEFENNRDIYDWLLDNLSTVPKPRPHQYEFARLNLTYTVLSKRKLLELVEGKHVAGWTDPRMPTISGLRRRGYRPEGIRAFCETIGVAKTNSLVEMELLESCIRDDLNTISPRVMCVLDPIKVVLADLAEGAVESIDAPYFPPDVGKPGSRAVPMTREIYIDRDDFALEPPKGWHRLAPGAEVRLRHAFVIKCDEVVKNSAGEVTELRCSIDRSPDKKTKGTIHWVSATKGLDVEVRIYDRLFTVERPEGGDEDYKTFLNPNSLVVKRGKAEPSLANAVALDRFQFERTGFFCVDNVDSKPGALVFNRTVALKDGWARQVARTSEEPKAAARVSAPKVAAAPSAPKAPAELSADAKALIDAHGISVEEARVIAGDAALRTLFEAAVSAPHNGPAKPIAGLVANELQRVVKSGERSVASLPFGAKELAELGALAADGTLNAKLAREVLIELCEKGGNPRAIVAAKGLTQVADAGALEGSIAQVLAQKADVVARYRAGEQKLFGVLVGEVMRATGGKANAKLLNDLLRKQLGA